MDLIKIEKYELPIFHLESAKRKRALLVNVQSTNVGWLEENLKGMNFDTKRVYSIKDALRLLKSTVNTFNFIFVEAGFESEELYSFPTLVRNLSHYGRVPVVLFSSNQADIHEEYALKYGFTKVISNHSGLSGLLKELKQYLEFDGEVEPRFPLRLPKEIYLKSGLIITDVKGSLVEGYSQNFLAVGTELIVDGELFKDLSNDRQGTIRILSCDSFLDGKKKYKIKGVFSNLNSKFFTLSRIMGASERGYFRFNKKAS